MVPRSSTEEDRWGHSRQISQRPLQCNAGRAMKQKQFNWLRYALRLVKVKCRAWRDANIHRHELFKKRQ